MVRQCKWDEDECMDRICNLIINSDDYAYSARFRLLQFMIEHHKELMND